MTGKVMILPESLGKNPISLNFQLLEGASLILWYHSNFCFHHKIFLYDSEFPTSLFFSHFFSPTSLL